MKPSTLRLVLLVSCCHGLVHVYELSFSRVEQLVAGEFGVDMEMTGWLGFSMRLPFGMFALAAGWLADRFGPKRLLLVYLAGASVAALLVSLSPSLAALFVVMFTLGTFAGIYHPAGVSLISQETQAETRPLALGYHGILGSAGIAAGPFLACLALAAGFTWRQYYLMLAVPGLLLAGLLLFRLPGEDDRSVPSANPGRGDGRARWDCYFILISAAMMAGIIYAAVMTFLPRYLSEAGLNLEGLLERLLGAIGAREAEFSPVSAGNLLTGLVLVLGILGQYTAGRTARPHTLEWMMALSFFAAAPCLLWMGFATGAARVWAAALFAPIFFMHQPVFNSLVAKYVPRRRRSLAYGLSFTAGFGIGGAGAAFAGRVQSTLGEYGPMVNYSTLAVLAVVVGVLCLFLKRRHASGEPPEPLNGTEALV